ncbi:replication initiator [Nesterenkonia aerolata]|uniref:replication initiator n=1 Tax=Nesterenkonia aerolata TaxID=3074079 RepID=UPI0035B575FE
MCAREDSEAPEALAVPESGRSGATDGEGTALDPVSKLYAGDLAGRVEAVGASLPCERPILVRNDSSGEVVKVRCGRRRTADCVSCSALYSGDAAAILRSGALDVDPGAVVVMLTLTAPSFGRVHSVPRGVDPRYGRRSGSIRRCACGEYHEPGSSLAGVPLHPEAYEYAGQADWNAAFGQLWNRTATRLSRAFGLDERLAYAGTTEWQSRGVIHAHLLVRLPAQIGASWYRDSSGRTRSRFIEETVRAVRTVYADRQKRWGSQVVAELIAAPGMEYGRLAKRTVGYIRKALAYSVKDLSAEAGGGSSDSAARRDHLVRCYRAGRLVECPRCGGAYRRRGCRSPRHRSFGYAGHALRKSRSWSQLTFRSLKARRIAFHGCDAPGEATWSVIGGGTVDYTVAAVQRGLMVNSRVVTPAWARSVGSGNQDRVPPSRASHSVTEELVPHLV